LVVRGDLDDGVGSADASLGAAHIVEESGSEGGFAVVEALLVALSIVSSELFLDEGGSSLGGLCLGLAPCLVGFSELLSVLLDPWSDDVVVSIHDGSLVVSLSGVETLGVNKAALAGVPCAGEVDGEWFLVEALGDSALLIAGSVEFELLEDGGVLLGNGGSNLSIVVNDVSLDLSEDSSNSLGELLISISLGLGVLSAEALPLLEDLVDSSSVDVDVKALGSNSGGDTGDNEDFGEHIK
jgi:hypothetical protein